MLALKIQSDEDETTEKIRGLLIPFEYTRLDNIIDVVFTTAKDAESVAVQEPENNGIEIPNQEENKQQHTPGAVQDEVRARALAALGRRENTHFIAHKRAQYWNADKSSRVVCPVSKKYTKGDYWYAFHPAQNDFLKDSPRGFLMLGCVGSDVAFAIPHNVISKLLPSLYVTKLEKTMYWHLNLYPTNNGGYQLVPKLGERVDLKPYEIKVV